jgi:hypothetical protein
MTAANKYQTVKVQIKGNTFSVMRVTGNRDYFNVVKLTNNPFGGPGKDFSTADALLDNYSSPAFKAAMIFALEDLGVEF